jgi:hypothetical protein
VIAPDVGGGFGQKIPLYREELTTAAASRLLGRPVRWIETRRENLLAALHAREDIVDVRAAVQSDGTILGLDVRILTDFGAYGYFPANYMARVVGMMIPGAYRLRDYRYAITAVLTNKCPAGPYRAPMLICSWVTEGTIDASLELGLTRRGPTPQQLAESTAVHDGVRLTTGGPSARHLSALAARLSAGAARRPARARPGASPGSAWPPISSRTRTAPSSTGRRASPDRGTTRRSSASSRAAPSRPRSASSARVRAT